MCTRLNSRPPSRPVIQYPAHFGCLLDYAVVDVEQTHNSAALAVDEDIGGDKRNGRGLKSVRFDVGSPPFRREDFLQKLSRGFNNVVPRFIVGGLGHVTDCRQHLTETN